MRTTLVGKIVLIGVVVCLSSFIFSQTSPKEIKEGAIAALEAINTPDHRLEKQIELAAEAIQKSIDKQGVLFLDNFRIVPPPLGNHVFDQEKVAVAHLEQAISWRGTPREIKITLQEVVQKLRNADALLAETAIDIAEMAVSVGIGNARELALAKKEYSKATKAKSNKAAIEDFGDAWRLAYKAVDGKLIGLLYITNFQDDPDPFVPVQATSTLTAQVKVYRPLFAGCREQTIEFKEIIKDSQGVVRTLSTRQSLPKGSRKDRFITVTLSLNWDGKNAQGSIVPSGTYNYLASARLLVKPLHPARPEHMRAESVPVAGTITVDSTPPVDTTPPVITAQINPQPNDNGWNNGDITVTFNATDSGSGIVTVTPPITVITEGANQVITGTASDNAGNSASVSVTVNIDKTVPAITASLTTQPNSNGWHNSDVTVTFNATDSGSGIATVTPSVTVTTEGANQVITGTTTDKAGNSASVSVTVNIDKTVPAITAITTPQPNSNGWHNSDVTITFNATDSGSGIATVTSPTIVTTEGANQTVTGIAVDNAGNSASATAIVNIDKSSPTLSLTPWDGATISTAKPELIAGYVDTLSGIQLSTLKVLLDQIDITAEFVKTTTEARFTVTTALTEGQHTFTAEILDIAGNKVVRTAIFSVDISTPTLPPDPSTIAPPVDNTVFPDLCSTTKFLYSGTNPIQTGVAADTIIPQRAAILRGKVLQVNGQPLPGVAIRILHHAEFGQTLSRVDGVFDLAVNGGGDLTVHYQLSEYLEAQRTVSVRWQDYTWLPDVILIQQDSQVTSITLNHNEPQVARGSVATDEDGSRQATLILPPGLQVQGYSNETLNIRLTEYTLGTEGPKAMPADLPLTTGYTYCVELSADEVANVEFNQPVAFYVENFLDFPVGGAVPVGYYDKVKGAWVPSDNGQIVKILAVNNSLVELDVDGSGQIADEVNLGQLGITDAERQKLATLYLVGQSLWRVPITHFSPLDYNWPFGPPFDAEYPTLESPETDNTTDDANETYGCSIEIENQILGETLAIAGTPFTLHYSSDRMLGRTAVCGLSIPLTKSTLPPGVKRVELEVKVAGKLLSQSFSPTPNQSYNFVWDGRNSYGQEIRGAVPATTKVGYVYNLQYQRPAQVRQSWARLSGVPLPVNRSQYETTLWQTHTTFIGGYATPTDARQQGMGGWSINVQHWYDPVGQMLYLGNGERRTAGNINRQLVPFAGTGEYGSDGDGGLARQAKLAMPQSLAFGPDGSLYIAEETRVRRIGLNDIIETVAGTGEVGHTGDGGPATQATLTPTAVAVDRSGSLYILDYDYYNDSYIRKVDRNGIITTVGPSGDYPVDIAVTQDGGIFISSYYDHCIRRLEIDGTLTHVAGNGRWASSGDNGPASLAGLTPQGIATALDGSLYAADMENCCIRRIGWDGIITTIAGIAGEGGDSGDGGLAIEALLSFPPFVTLDADANVYLNQGISRTHIRRIGSDGIISTVVGANEDIYISLGKLAIGPDNGIYAVGDDNRIYRLGTPFPEFTGNDIIIPAEDGTELYYFSPNGRHLRTVDSMTGLVKYTFNYNASGYLSQIVDIHNNITTIERNGYGEPLAIVGPYGQRTEFQTDTDGYLNQVRNPAGETFSMTYENGGLLATITDPKDGVHRFSYDSTGRFLKNEDPVGGYTELSRTELDGNAWQITQIEATGGTNYVTTYIFENLPTGEIHRVIRDAYGSTTDTLIAPDGKIKAVSPDGTIMEVVQAPDPRFEMAAPFVKSLTITTPSGLQYTETAERSVTLRNPVEPLSLEQLVNIVAVNGRTEVATYDATAKTITNVSTAGRTSVATLDEKGRVIKVEAPWMATTTIAYDNRGRISTTTEGTGSDSRVTSIVYDDRGYVVSMVNPLVETTSFERDAVGRILRQILPDGRVINYTYDPFGETTTITPPGKLNHNFTYTPVELLETYRAPDVGSNNSPARYSYNLAQQLTTFTNHDDTVLSYNYDDSGRLLEIVLPGGNIGYTYNRTTDQLTQITAPDNSIITYGYDGTLTTSMAWNGTVNGSVGCIYDTDFRIVSQSVNGGNAISLAYNDLDGLLTRAGNLTLEYNPSTGQCTGTIQGAFRDFLSYNNFGELANYRVTYNGSDIFETSYTMDKLSRITEKVETIAGQMHSYQYFYDHRGQLVEVKTDGLVTAYYAYDSNGNRLSRTSQTETITGAYDAQDRMIYYGANVYQYNANGELQSRTNSDGTTSYTYTALGTLQAVGLTNGTQIEYVLDGQERRVGKKVNGILVQGFLYENAIKPVTELDGNGQIVARFIYAEGNTPDYIIKNGQAYQIISDHLGSPRLVVEVNTGTVVQQMDYDEYGRILLDTNPGFQPFVFAGGIYDRHTGLVQFGLREYDPENGRWTTKDPVRFDGGDTNLYRYVGNDPVNDLDPTGLSLKGAIGWLSPVDPFAVAQYYSAYYNAMLAGNYGEAGTALFWLSTENPFTGKAKKVGKAAKEIAKGSAEKLFGKGGRNPIKKAGRKKQGREVNEGKRQGKNWTPRNPPKPMKKHTPKKDHRKDKEK